MSGTVSVEGSGLGEVSVTLAGAASQSATTGSNGGYSFDNVPAGGHTVQISGAPADVTFDLTTKPVTITTSGQTATADFSGTYIRTSSITGSVTAGGEGIVATVTATGTGMLMDEEPAVGTSDTDGDFVLPGLRAGGYSVTISEFGDIEFPVTTREVTVAVGLPGNVSFNAPGEDGPATGTGVFLLITGVTDDDDDDAKTSGRVTATIDIERERGDAPFEKVALYVDGAEVATQFFGLRPEPAEEPARAAQEAAVVFSLSFDSDKYDSTGAATYPNGTHLLLAGVTVAGSEAEDYSQQWDVELENDDGYVLTAADLGDNSARSDDGRRWYGGPDNGTIDITALPVSYTGGSVTSVGASFCGKDLTDSDGSDGYTFAFKCAGHESSTEGEEPGDMLTLSSAGTDGEILGDHPFPAFVDFKGPTGSPILVANPNGRQMGWLNADVSLSAERKKPTDDALLIPGEKGTGGVGGYNMAVRVGKDLKAALAAAVASSLPAESASAGSYCAVAIATDALGNESPAADSTATCRGAPAGADTLIAVEMEMVYGAAMDDLSGQHLAFGVDMTDPVIELDDDLMTRFADDPDPVVFDANDDESNVGNSGLFGGDGVLVKVQRRTASKTDCAAVSAEAGEAGAVGTGADKDCGYVDIDGDQVTFGDSASVAYYTVSGMAKDQAGNTSASVSHTFVYDNDVATATAPAVPGVIAAGKSFQGATYLNDNLSIRDYYGTVNFASPVGLNIGIGLPVALDDFDASSFTRLNHSVTATVTTYAGLQNGVGGDLTQLSGVSVYVRDQAQIQYGEAETTSIDLANIESIPHDSLGHRTGTYTYEWVGRADDNTYSVCGLAACSDEKLKTSLKVEVRVIAIEDGTFRDPFERVDFLVADVNGASWVVGSDDSGTSGRKGGMPENEARYRTWSYSVTLPGTMVNMATRGGTRGAGAGGDAAEAMIRAIAVNKSGVGLLLSTEVTIDTTKPAS